MTYNSKFLFYSLATQSKFLLYSGPIEMYKLKGFNVLEKVSIETEKLKFEKKRKH